MLVPSSGLSNPDIASAQVAPGAATDGANLAGFDVQHDVLDHFSSGRFEPLAAVLATDCLLLLPALRPVSGIQRVLRVLRDMRRRYETITFETVLQFRSPDDVFVANSRVHGRRKDGSSYDNDAITLIRLDRSGRIALITDYYKDTSYAERADKPQPRHA